MKQFLIIISILLLAGAGYFTYEKWVKHADVNKWSFIPSDASMVFEMELLKNYREIYGFPAWKRLKETAAFRGIEEDIAYLDSINGKGGFQAIFEETPVLVSAHNIANDKLDFLFVVDIQNISQNTFVGATIGRLQNSGLRFKTRNYNGYKISEISEGSRIFTCIFFKNYFLASFTPYLVEDAIRTIEDERRPFEDNFLRLDAQQNDGNLNLYVNYDKLGSLLSGATKDAFYFPMSSGRYAVSLDSNYIDISGFTYSEEGWISTHQEQPSTFDIAEIVPENTALIYHVSSANIQSWKQLQINHLRATAPRIRQFQDSLESMFDFQAGQILDLVDEELAILKTEPGNSRESRKFFIIEVKDTGEALKFFNQLTERVARSRGDSIYKESYSENEIQYLPVKNLPSAILGDLGDGFDECFYINYRNYLIFSNNLQELKALIASIRNEDTWGKSLRMNSFLQETNNAANISLFVNIPRARNLIVNKLNSNWKNYILNDIPAYQSFELAAFQFTYVDGNYFTNYTFSQPEEFDNSIRKINPKSATRFASILATKPYLVKTHAYKEFDILVQDSANTIYYLDRNQNAQWSEQIQGRIISEVFPIDFYKNGKIQYAFATTDQIHIWDRSGQSIPGYPKKVAENSRISQFNVIDYDLSRNYRFAISDEEGKIFLTDKELKLLDGWGPKMLKRRPLVPLNHQRIGRRDVMLSIHADGKVHLMNRRSEPMRGFPFDTQQALDDNYFITSSNSLSNTAVTVISEGGELTQINLEGDVIKRDQLIKTQQDADFSILPDRSRSSFLIIRKEGNSYQVLDDTGNLLFQKDYLSIQPILTQYYRFGAGKDLVIFTDTANQTLYIYDKSGNLVTGNPLNSAHEVGIIYSNTRKEFQVFTTWNANLEVYTFKY